MSISFGFSFTAIFSFCCPPTNVKDIFLCLSTLFISVMNFALEKNSCLRASEGLIHFSGLICRHFSIKSQKVLNSSLCSSGDRYPLVFIIWCLTERDFASDCQNLSLLPIISSVFSFIGSVNYERFPLNSIILIKRSLVDQGTKRGVPTYISKRMHPKDQMSICSLYIYPRTTSGAR